MIIIDDNLIVAGRASIPNSAALDHAQFLYGTLVFWLCVQAFIRNLPMGAVKVDRKYSPVLFGAIMAAIMGFVMSLVITLINIGPAPNFIEAWARAYGVSFAIAMPTAIGVSQIARKLVARMTS